MNFFRILSRISVPLLVAAAFVYLINAAGAVRDNILYAVEVIAAAPLDDKAFRLAILTVFLVCLGLLLWASAQARVRSLFVEMSSGGKTLVSLVIALMATIPMLALLWAVRSATNSNPVLVASLGETSLQLQGLMAAIAFVVAFLVFALPRRPFIENFDAGRLALFSLVVATPTIALMIALALDPIKAAREIGAFAITTAFFVAVLFVINLFFYASRSLGAPVGRIAALAVVAMYAFMPPQFRPIGNTDFSRDVLGMKPQELTDLRTRFITAAKGAIPSASNDIFSKLKDKNTQELEQFNKALVEFGQIELKYGALAIGEQRGVPHVLSAFYEWLHSRPDFELYRKAGRKYPVFLVSAQGGGFYAASHTAMVLSRLQDICPSFRDHVFLISGVSGGSLGAAVFANLARNDTAPRPVSFCAENGQLERNYQARVEQFFEADFLSPVLATFFFQDIPRLLLPILPRRIDRAWALEEGFKRAVETDVPSGGANFFAEPFFGKWKAKESVPALALNTTDVTTASSYVISDVMWSFMTRLRRQLPEAQRACQPKIEKIMLEAAGDPVATGRMTALAQKCFLDYAKSTDDTPDVMAQSHILELAPDLQLSVAEAVSLSARFPYLTPTGVLDMRLGLPSLMQLATTDIAQFVDGGYSDASGFGYSFALAREIDRTARQIAAQPGGEEVPFELVFITLLDSIDGGQEMAIGGRSYTNEALAPLRTALKAREIAQSSVSVLANFKDFKIINVPLAGGGFRPPLTWALSRQTRKQIWARSGWLPSMGMDTALVEANQVGARMVFNHAPFEDVVTLLGPRGPAPEPAEQGPQSNEPVSVPAPGPKMSAEPAPPPAPQASPQPTSGSP